MKKTYVKCLAILIQNCYASKIIDERNFDKEDTEGVLQFCKKYSDDKYRCVQIVLEN